MAKADLSDDVIKVGILAILVGGVYFIWQSSQLISQGGGRFVETLETGGAAILETGTRPATWVASGTEYWGRKLWELPSDIVEAVDPEPERTLLGYDEGSWLWGYGPKK